MKISDQLSQTESGSAWLSQIAPADIDIAKTLLDNLTLISGSEFTRELDLLINQNVVAEENSVALYAAREIPIGKQYFPTDNQNFPPLSGGSNQGSEAIVANLIRQYSKGSNEFALNHPTIKEMRTSKTRAIIVIDDFIGSGNRAFKFINAIWKNRTIRSWHSAGFIKIKVLAYNGTPKGLHKIHEHPSKPETRTVRGIPTIDNLNLHEKTKRKLTNFCLEYGKRASKRAFRLGYDETKATLVFQHGCPNNTPSVLWSEGTSTNPWQPIFKNRVIQSEEHFLFPAKHPIPDFQGVDVSESNRGYYSIPGCLARRGVLGMQIITILFSLSKGLRRLDALSYSTGLTNEKCLQILNRLEKWKFILPSHRLTARGRAELTAAKKEKTISQVLSNKEESYYHPSQLRRSNAD